MSRGAQGSQEGAEALGVTCLLPCAALVPGRASWDGTGGVKSQFPCEHVWGQEEPLEAPPTWPKSRSGSQPFGPDATPLRERLPRWGHRPFHL